jgi:hypothetical protein
VKLANGRAAWTSLFLSAALVIFVASGGAHAVAHGCSPRWRLSHPKPNIELLAVSAHGTEVWAVGNRSKNRSLPLALRWNGARWAAVPTVGLPHGRASFEDVAVFSSHNVWGAGSVSSGRSYSARPFLTRWDGTRWHPIRIPLPADTKDATVSALVGRNGGDVWALGTRDVRHAAVWSRSRWFAVHLLAGHAPQFMSIPVTGVYLAVDDAAVVPEGGVWAVGDDAEGPGSNEGYAARWDGRRWRDVSPTVPSTSPPCEEERGEWGLTGVAAASSTAAWTVGWADCLNIAYKWNGREWQRIHASAAVGDAVAASSSTDVWIVGGNSASHFYGARWINIPTPAAPAKISRFVASVALTVDGEVWAVGRDSGAHRAMVMHYGCS